MTDSTQSLRKLFQAQSTKLRKSLESYEKAVKEKDGQGQSDGHNEILECPQVMASVVAAASGLGAQDYDPKAPREQDSLGLDLSKLYYSLKPLGGKDFAWRSDAEVSAKVVAFCQKLEVVRPALCEESTEFPAAANGQDTLSVEFLPEEMRDLTTASTRRGSEATGADGTILSRSSFVSGRLSTGQSGL